MSAGSAPLTGPLTVRNAWVSAGATKILSGIDFKLHPGEMCGMIGPSGAGKSTLIKVLLGLREPEDGEASLGGGPVTAAGPVGYVPQDDALHATLTVRESLDFAAQLRLPGLDEKGRAARIDALCRQVGLDERLDLRVKRLSGGQRKRVAVAMELLTSPGVLILDEPTSGLDPGMEVRMMDLFSEVARKGRIVLVSTHAMQSLSKCDALMVLVAGHLAYFGPPAEAADHFRASSYVDIFEKLPLRQPAAWKKAWEESPLRARFAARPGPALRPEATRVEAATPAAAPVAAPAAAPAAPALSAEAQLAALKAQLKK